ncbi:MAG TPA: biotin--[acetyl-CoA-carboxylase] ligase [Thermodesulfobacteriota bacterium]|jgi:BirA family biotin operon repressor/biotin-[acetyl-CoA-carboxylase] ligase|nr:biotin--[acetyl-CoA-carboxylase] ligase [Thermodesulfobacteriota bacterium]
MDMKKDEDILQLLRDYSSEFLSGEEISRRLKVSRTAVWKGMNRLRMQGYEIQALTRSGYRLIQSPDLLTPSEIKPILKTKWMGRTIHHLHSLDSTNSKAYQLALNGAEEGEVVIAESQEKGRGRLGRQWFSPPFLNLYLSVILRPKIPPHQASLITLMAAVATADAIEKFSGLPPLIKWPNDILLRDRKVAGLLNEIHSEMDRIHFVILGIGVNLNMDGKTFSKEIRAVATSLRIEMGRTVSRKAFLQFLLLELERWYSIFLKEGSNAILKAWRDRAQIKGRRVKITSFSETLAGVAVDVDSDGALILETEDGKRKRVVAGDIQYRR